MKARLKCRFSYDQNNAVNLFHNTCQKVLKPLCYETATHHKLGFLLYVNQKRLRRFFFWHSFHAVNRHEYKEQEANWP